jgi:hypothetical protein
LNNDNSSSNTTTASAEATMKATTTTTNKEYRHTTISGASHILRKLEYNISTFKLVSAHVCILWSKKIKKTKKLQIFYFYM